MWANMRFVEGAGELLIFEEERRPLAKLANSRVFLGWERLDDKDFDRIERAVP